MFQKGVWVPTLAAVLLLGACDWGEGAEIDDEVYPIPEGVIAAPPPGDELDLVPETPSGNTLNEPEETGAATDTVEAGATP